MICPRCQSEVQEGAVFCLNCGLRVVSTGNSSLAEQAKRPVAKQAAPESPKPDSSPQPERPAGVKGPAVENQAKLVIQSGAKTGREFNLDKPECTLGRVPGSDIFVEDVRVSRNHARIVNRLGEFFIEDLGSANGTFVNGNQIIDSVRLRNGDVINVGGSALLFQEPAASAETAEVRTAKAEAGTKDLGRPAAGSAASQRQGAGQALTPVAGEVQAGKPSPSAAETNPPASVAIQESRSSSVAKQAQTGLLQAAKAGAEIRSMVESNRRGVQEITDRAVSLRSDLDASGDQLRQLESQLSNVLGFLKTLEEDQHRQANKVQEAASKLKEIVAEHNAQAEQAQYDELLSVIDNLTGNPRDIDFVSALAKRAEPIAKLLRGQRTTISALEEVVKTLDRLTETH